ncbi:MAG: hypothetical protein AB7G93_17890 [Bdellovibrionales bacterium]
MGRVFFLIAMGLPGTWGGVSGWAATAYKQSLHTKEGVYLEDGVFTGGHAGGKGISLLTVKRGFSAKTQLERVVIELGDSELRPLGKKMGYFQVSMDAQKRRLVLDLSQLRLSRISERQVRHLFRSSPHVASVDFTLDPEDKAGTLVLNLKKPMRLEVFQLTGDKKNGRIVMDLVPIKVARKG